MGRLSRPLRVLVACEYSGRVRDAFIAAGHDAVSCDLEPSDTPGPHIMGDALAAVAKGWDLLIAFPPCTDLTSAGARLWPQKIADGRLPAAAALVQALWDAPVERVCIENPMGWLNTHWRPPTQTINPYEFGDPYKKRTCLWLRGLPKLAATDVVEPVGYWVDGAPPRKRRFPVSGFRDPKLRSLTFRGVAAAMADQWGGKVA